MTRLKCVIVACVFALSAIMPSLTFAETQYDREMNHANIETLIKLEILPADTRDSEFSEYVKRGNFCKIIAKAAGYAAYSNSAQVFSDVGVENDCYGAVCALYKANILKGNTEGKFEPDAEITTTDAAVIMMRILGYELMAEANGGYPVGYTLTAKREGLFDGLEFVAEKITLSEMARMVFNFLLIGRMESTYGANAVSRVVKNSNLMNSMYKLYFDSGIVEKNEITGLGEEEGCGNGRVQINGKTYFDKNNEASGLLGYKTDFLYSDDDELSIFQIYASSDNRVLRIEYDDIDKASDMTFRYDKGDGQKSVQIDFNSSVIWNGVGVPEINGLNFIPQYGELSLIDNNGDSKYDVVFVREYQNFRVKSTDINPLRIYDSDGTVLDFGSMDSSRCRIYKNGALTEAATIKADSVISVCMSRDSSYAELFITEEKIEGIVERISGDVIYVNGEAYEYSAELSEKIKSGETAALSVGDSLDGYLDVKGRIAFLTEDPTNGYSYGFFIGFEEDGFGSLTVKVLDQTGEIRDLSVKRNVIADTVTVAPEQLKDMLTASGKAKRQLIKFKANKNRKLNEIYLPSDTAQTDDRMLERFYSRASRIWRPSARSFDGKLAINEETIFFMVPIDVSKQTQAKNYTVTDLSVLQPDFSYSVEAYDRQDADVATVAVVYTGGIGNIGATTNISVITDVCLSIDKNGDTGLQLSYYYAGTMRSAFVADTVTVDGDELSGSDLESSSLRPEVGDVYRMASDSDGKICIIERVLDISEEDKTAGKSNPSSKTYNANPRTFYGKVFDKNKAAFMLGTEDGTYSEVMSVHDSRVRYFLCDLSGRNPVAKTVSGDYLDRCNNSEDYRILVRMSYSFINDCIIYKFK